MFQRIKFLVGFIQFSRSFVTALILLSTHNLCTALDGSADDSKQAYTGFALEALQRSQSNSLPTHASDIEAITANKPSSELTEQAESLKKIIPSAEQNSVAKSISDQTSKNVLNTLNSPNTILDKLVSTNAYTRPPIQRPKSVQHVQLLISWSMTELDINSALSLASQDQDILVVMKGFIDSDIKTALTRLQNRVSKFHPVPNVVIDPKPFQIHQISTAPALIYTPDPSTPGRTYKVSGLLDPAWLKRESTYSPTTTDFGQKGTVSPVTELDPIQLMQKRVASIDWDKKRKDASDRFWSKQSFVDLPLTVTATKRTVDPTVTLKSDILDQEGRAIIKAGATVNPLSVMQLTKPIIIFDSTDPKQVEYVFKLYQQLRLANKNPLLLSTRFDQSAGWDGYQKLLDKLSAHVYKLTDDVRQRFDIRSVPTLVYSSGAVFVVEEHTLSEVVF